MELRSEGDAPPGARPAAQPFVVVAVVAGGVGRPPAEAARRRRLGWVFEVEDGERVAEAAHHRVSDIITIILVFFSVTFVVIESTPWTPFPIPKELKVTIH